MVPLKPLEGIRFFLDGISQRPLSPQYLVLGLYCISELLKMTRIPETEGCKNPVWDSTDSTLQGLMVIAESHIGIVQKQEGGLTPSSHLVCGITRLGGGDLDGESHARSVPRLC